MNNYIKSDYSIEDYDDNKITKLFFLIKLKIDILCYCNE